MRAGGKISGLLYLLGAGVLILIDFAIKQWAAVFLQPVKQIDLIPNILSLYYHQNYGAAFGILQQRRFFLVAVTAVVLSVLVVTVLLKRVQGPLLLSAFSLIIAGGFGNLIDRVRLGYVIDYVYFEPINFPIFNFADCCVVAGTALFAFYVLFVDDRTTQKKLPGEG